MARDAIRGYLESLAKDGALARATRWKSSSIICVVPRSSAAHFHPPLWAPSTGAKVIHTRTKFLFALSSITSQAHQIITPNSHVKLKPEGAKLSLDPSPKDHNMNFGHPSRPYLLYAHSLPQPNEPTLRILYPTPTPAPKLVQITKRTYFMLPLPTLPNWLRFEIPPPPPHPATSVMYL
jgi:hypothetical protein